MISMVGEGAFRVADAVFGKNPLFGELLVHIKQKFQPTSDGDAQEDIGAESTDQVTILLQRSPRYSKPINQDCIDAVTAELATWT